MFDQLLKLVEQNSGDVIINNPAIPNNQNNAAIRSVTDEIVNGLKNNVSSGNIQQLTSLFQNGNIGSLSNHPVVSQIISSVAATFSSKFNVPSSTAQTMASSLLPTIINQLISKTNNPNDNSFNFSSIMQSLGGNGNLNVGGLIDEITGNSGNGGGLLGGLASKLFGK